MKIHETTLNIGGLLRCCTRTLDDLYMKYPNKDYPDQTIVTCHYCKKPTLILDGGVWRWNRENSDT